jgi:hypothetical protein
MKGRGRTANDRAAIPSNDREKSSELAESHGAGRQRFRSGSTTHGGELHFCYGSAHFFHGLDGQPFVSSMEDF